MSKEQVQEEVTQQEDVQYEPCFSSIDILQEGGISAVDIQKMKASGYSTVESIVTAVTKNLESIKGFSEAKVIKIREACYKLKDPLQFTVNHIKSDLAIFNEPYIQTGTQHLESRSQLIKICTGASALDELMGGGVETLSITEIFGEFRAGKTQFCHTLCVTTQLPVSDGGGGGKVIYIDTEGTFRPERIKEIAEEYGLNAEDVLDNVLFARVSTCDQQMEIINRAAAAIVADPVPFRLMIVDSIMGLFRVEYSGRGELAGRQQALNKHLSQLVKLAENLKIAVVIVNQVSADPGASAMFGKVLKPIGGHILAHASTTRLYFKKGKGEQRIVKLYDSPCMPECDVTIQIAKKGICDAD